MAKMSKTPMNKISGSSMWSPNGKGDNTTIWKKWDSTGGNNSSSMGGFEKKNPGMKSKVSGKMSGNCPGCGG